MMQEHRVVDPCVVHGWMVGRGLNGIDSGGRAFVVAVVVFLVGWRGRAAVQMSAQI